MQNVLISGIKWDEELKNKEFLSWKMWLLDLKKDKNIRIPCFYLRDALNDKATLHIFCDASKKAFVMQVKRPLLRSPIGVLKIRKMNPRE